MWINSKFGEKIDVLNEMSRRVENFASLIPIAIGIRIETQESVLDMILQDTGKIYSN
jgi:uncharacterized FAD-dependent dehydrogenase